MGVEVGADVVGDVLDEECCEVSGFVVGARSAEGPFHVGQLRKAFALGQEAAVGNAWRKGVVGAAQKTHDGIDGLAALREILPLVGIGA